MNLKIWRMAWDMLETRERKLAFLSLFVSIIAALVSGVMVASIMPFLGVIANPSRIAADFRLNRIYHFFEFNSAYHFIVALGGMSLSVIVFATLMQILRVYVLSTFTLMQMHNLSMRLMTNYLHQPYAFFRERHTGDMGTQILNETQQVVGQFFRPAANIVAAAFSIIVLVALLLWVNPSVTLSSLSALSIVYGAALYYSKRKLNELGILRLRSNKARFKIANEALGGIKDVMLAGCERNYLKRFHKPSHNMARTQVIAAVFSEMPSYILQGVALGGIIIMGIILLEPQAIENRAALADLLPLLGVFAFAGLRMIPELQRLYHGLTLIHFSGPGVIALHEDLHGLQAGRIIPSAEPEPLHAKREIALRNATYRYAGAEFAGLHNINLTIETGRKIGVVGTSGAGKTTLADLLLGLNEPQSGSLEVDGIRIDAANVRAWQKSIGYVPQDIFLTDASVAENIALGIEREAIDMQQVEEACRIAHLDSFVTEELAEGYDTKIGERGVRLSGGQRQRIGIARALYHDASFFVFDEATSALDNETEREVMKAINGLPQDKTILMIAHRLSTVKTCDKIILLDRGKVVGYDSWDALYQSNRLFKQLADAAG